MEYLTTYGWAILIVGVITAILYLYSTTPTTIVPASCVFISGVYCNAMVIGVNPTTHATTVALFLTNSQPYPLANPYLFVQLNGANSTGISCSPHYALAAGSMVCILPLSTKTSLGQFLAGRAYLNATYCGLNPNYSHSNLCKGSPKETYAGRFQSHVEPLINTNSTITLTVQNSTQPANNAHDPLIATVKLLGYPLRGATVNFTTNSIGYTISPNYTTTNTTGKALSAIWGSKTGNVVVTASYAGLNATANIVFIPAFNVRFNVNWPYCSSAGQIITIDGIGYTCPQLSSSTVSWGSGTVHSCDINNPVIVNSLIRGQCSITSGSVGSTCTANSNTTITINCTSQYYLTMAAGTGGSVLPASNWYNSNTIVPISQSANSGFQFNGWTGTGTVSYTGASSSASVTMNSPVSETSSYVTNVVFTESGLPGGTSWAVTLNGNTLSSTGTSITFTNIVPGSYSWSTASAISCGTGCQYLASASSGNISTLSGSTSQPLTYATQYYLTMSASTGGTVSPSSEWVNSGAQVTITASPTPGYYLSGWAGSGSGSYTGTLTSTGVAISGPISESATFVPGYPVTFQETGLPAGSLWSTTFNGQQKSTTNGTIVFTNIQTGSYPWSTSSSVSCGTGCQYYAPTSSGTLSVSGATNQQVTYGTQYYLTMQASGGSVSPSSSWYASGSTVGISASASSGYVFSSWSGSGTGSYSGTSPQATVTMSSAITETASFTQVPQSYYWDYSGTSASYGPFGALGSSCTDYFYSGPNCSGAQTSTATNVYCVPAGGETTGCVGQNQGAYCAGSGACYQAVLGICYPFNYYGSGCPWPDYCQWYGSGNTGSCIGYVCSPTSGCINK